MPGHVDSAAVPPVRVDDVAPTRVFDLLRATTTVVQRLDLEEVMERVIESAMELVGARYGALGVIAADGKRLERFLHVGMDAATVFRVGNLPEGKGLLGAVTADRAPIRLDHMSDDPRSAGFPAHYPAMDGFLGVPIMIGDELFGNLYLADGAFGPFTKRDQDLVVDFAATAGIAIDNARMYHAARAREAWSATTADVMAAMLESDSEDVLEVIADHVGTMIDVDLVSVLLPHGDDELRVAAANGSTAGFWRGKVFASAGTLSAKALETRRAASVGGYPAQGPSAPFELGPTVAIPVFAGEEPLGALVISRRPHAAPLTTTELDMAFAFAAQAGVAIEVVRARHDRRRLELTSDRVRIARNLHDDVIQRLLGAGLSLHAALATADVETAAVIELQVVAVDAAIEDIRTVISALSSCEPVKADSRSAPV